MYWVQWTEQNWLLGANHLTQMAVEPPGWLPGERKTVGPLACCCHLPSAHCGPCLWIPPKQLSRGQVPSASPWTSWFPCTEQCPDIPPSTHQNNHRLSWWVMKDAMLQNIHNTKHINMIANTSNPCIYPEAHPVQKGELCGKKIHIIPNSHSVFLLHFRRHISRDYLLLIH